MSGMRYQPQGLTKINRSHPLAAGLVDVWVPHETSFGLITGYDSETKSVGTNKVTTEGLGYNLTSVPRRYSATIFNDQSIAWLIVAYRDSSTGNKYSSVVKKDLSVIALQEWDASVRAIMWVPGAAANISYSLTAPLRNKVSVFAGLVGPNEKGIMLNGGEFKTFTGGNTIVATTNALGIGGDAKGTERAPQWTTLAVFAWQGDKLPTSAELRDLSLNPWQLFAEPEEEAEYSEEYVGRIISAGIAESIYMAEAYGMSRIADLAHGEFLSGVDQVQGFGSVMLLTPETFAALHTQESTAQSEASATETTTGSDAGQTEAATTLVQVEQVGAGHAQTGTANMVAQVSEPVVVQHSQESIMTAVSISTEAATVGDLPETQSGSSVAQAESGSMTDSLAATRDTASQAVEQVVPNHGSNATALLTSSIVEPVTGADAGSSGSQAATSSSEAFQATDLPDTQNGVFVSSGEALVAFEGSYAIGLFGGYVVESSVSDSSIGVTASMGVQALESTGAWAAESASGQYSLTAQETTVALDGQSTSSGQTLTVTETMGLSDAVTGLQITLVLAGESVHAGHNQGQNWVTSALQAESSAAKDFMLAGNGYGVSKTEYVGSSDVYTPHYNVITNAVAQEGAKLGIEVGELLCLAERMYHIPPQSRVYTVDPQFRNYLIDPQVREYDIPGQGTEADFGI